MDIRSKKLVAQLNVQEKEKTIKFFESLHQQIIGHTIQNSMVLNTQTAFTQTPSIEQNNTMIKEKYLVPNRDYAMNFNTALNTHISTITTNSPLTKSFEMNKPANNLFVQLLLKSSRELNVQYQKIYLHRLSGLVDVILCNLKK